MRILIAGDYHSAIHERAFERAFGELGHETHRFAWHPYFGRREWENSAPRANNRFMRVVNRIQDRFIVGPSVGRLNRDLRELCRQVQPDLLFVYRGTHVLPRTLAEVRPYVRRIFGYNNDDPFGPHYPYLWRHFLAGVPLYDHLFAYRQKNLEDYRGAGARSVSLLRSYYIRELNHPLPELGEAVVDHDVVFAGHYEPDGRDKMLVDLVDAGVRLRVYGPEWRRSPLFEALRDTFREPVPRGAEYNEVLARARIALVFLSKLNSDTYTRRCFEIPAAGTFMLAEHSPDLESMFTEGVEAEYFRSSEELIRKIQHYLEHDVDRERIARAGRERLLADEHEVTDRAREILAVYSEHRGESIE